MGRPVEISLLNITIHESKVESLLQDVVDFKYFQIRNLENIKKLAVEELEHEHSILQKKIKNIEIKMNEIETHLISIFHILDIDYETIKIPPKQDRYVLNVKTVNDLIDILNYELENLSVRLKKNISKQSDYEKKIADLKVFRKSLLWLDGFEFSTKKLMPLSQFKFLFGSDTNKIRFSEEILKLEEKLDQAEVGYIIEKEINEKDEMFCFIIINKINEHLLNDTIDLNNFQALADLDKYYNENGLKVDKISKEIIKCEEELKSINNFILSKKNRKNMIYYRGLLEILDNLKIYIKVERSFFSDPHTKIVHVDAFVRSIDQELICNTLLKKYETSIKIKARVIQRTLKANDENKTKKDVDKDSIHIDEVEDVPSIFKKSIFSPFSRIVGLYGVPNYSEIDPTPFFAITFSFLFGMMFGDIGHGLVFIILGLYYILRTKLNLRKSKFEKGNPPREKDKAKRDFGIIFIWMGFAAMIGGVFYGEVFGNPTQEVFGFGPLVANPLHGDDPIGGVMKILKMSIIIGVAHLSLGWIIQAANYILDKKVFLAFVDSFMKILLISLGTYLIFTWGFEIEEWLQPPYPILLAIIPGLLMVVGRLLGKTLQISYLKHEKYSTIFGESGMELGETYLSIISNVASYSRILALSFAHMGLLLIVGELAFIMEDMREVIIIGGNAFVIMVEGLIASIHALRLEFYEFFGKFYLGDGVLYQAKEVKHFYSNVTVGIDY